MTWNYAPYGINKCYNEEFAAALALKTGFPKVGGTFVKAQYRGYTDSSFRVG